MATRRIPKTASLAVKTAELALAAPQVVAHRVARMATAGSVLSERDRKEFRLMGTEKVAAFTESLNAMALQALRANQAMAMSWFRLFWFPWLGRGPFIPSSHDWHKTWVGILNKGIAPVHQTATANAKRLGKARSR